MRILGAKYKVNHDWLNRDPPKYASPIWNAIEGAKEIIVKGVCYLIGDGVSINIWKDLWVPWIHNCPETKDRYLCSLASDSFTAY